MFFLAERLGCTRSELCARMSVGELHDWVAHDLLRAAEQEHARREAEMEARMNQR